jgi:hypothetical protein
MEHNLIETIEFDSDEVVAKIFHDVDGVDFCNPREWDNIGTMVCWHPDYLLGDEQITRDQEVIQNEINEIIEGGAVIMPLYLMDHSGISMSTSSGMFKAFDAEGWDWGQVGFIYASYAKLKNEFTSTSEGDLINKGEKTLTAEVEVYDSYLQGEIYGYVIEDKDGEHLDSCWGYVGDFDYVCQEARNAAAFCLEDINREKVEVRNWQERDVVTC